MFSALRQNSVLYILDKTDGLDLKIAQVTSVSSPQYQGLIQYVDVNATIGNEQLEFKQLPANLSTISKDNLIVSESQQDMFTEVSNIVSSSEQIISEDNINYHRRVVENGKAMYSKLNPEYAKQQAREEKLDNLENKVKGIDKRLDDIAAMLSRALNN